MRAAIFLVFCTTASGFHKPAQAVALPHVVCIRLPAISDTASVGCYSKRELCGIINGNQPIRMTFGLLILFLFSMSLDPLQCIIQVVLGCACMEQLLKLNFILVKTAQNILKVLTINSCACMVTTFDVVTIFGAYLCGSLQ